jgi:hypothetical protein
LAVQWLNEVIKNLTSEKETKMTKIIHLLFFSFFFILVSCINQFGMTGPEKPVLSDKLTTIWKDEFENQYNCKIDYLGLDDEYQEDTIIYLNLKFKKNSLINEKLIENWREISEEIANSFYQKTNNKKIQYLRIYYAGYHIKKSIIFDNLKKTVAK